MLYTIVSLEDVFYQEPEPRQTEKTEFGYVECTTSPEGRKICRVISTDPSIYLNPGNAPGRNYSTPSL